MDDRTIEDWRNEIKPPQLRWTYENEDLTIIPNEHKYAVYENGDCVRSSIQMLYQPIGRLAILVLEDETCQK
jgi:hypothetical protein